MLTAPTRPAVTGSALAVPRGARSTDGDARSRRQSRRDVRAFGRQPAASSPFLWAKSAGHLSPLELAAAPATRRGCSPAAWPRSAWRRRPGPDPVGEPAGMVRRRSGDPDGGRPSPCRPTRPARRDDLAYLLGHAEATAVICSEPGLAKRLLPAVAADARACAFRRCSWSR